MSTTATPPAPTTPSAPAQSSAMTPATRQYMGIREMLEKNLPSIRMALPKHLTPERMLRVALTAVQRTPALLDCDPRSLVGAVVQASELGLEPSGVMGHAYLVPFRNHKNGGRMEVQLIPGYKGLLDLARRSGQILTVFAREVYANDKFKHWYGLKPGLLHEPTAAAEPGEIIAFYAVATFKDGAGQFEVMWKREVDAIKKGSKSGNNGPWVSHYVEMGKKTALRRLCKMLPSSIELQKAVVLDEAAESERPQTFDTLPTAAEMADAQGAMGSGLDGLTKSLEQGSESEESPETKLAREKAEQAERDAAGAEARK